MGRARFVHQSASVFEESLSEAEKSLRVLDLTEFYSVRGGVRCHLDSKSDVLSRTGHEHWVVAPGPDENRPQASSNDDGASPRGHMNARARARVVRVGGPTLPYDPNYHLMWRPDRVRALIASARPDVLEVNSPYVAVAVARGLRPEDAGIRTYYWHVDFVDAYLGSRLPGGGILGRIREQLVARAWDSARRWLAPCDAVFTSSTEQAEKLSAQGIRNVVALSAGVDRRVFHAGRRSEGERRRWLGERTNALFLVAAGRLAGEKRWDVVIDAFLKFRERHAAVLVLFGEGPERPFLERRAAACPDVVFAGFEPDPGRLARAFASADALVHGGPYETFGIAVAQAASCGLPLVVPDRGGAAALVDLRAGARYRAMDAAACAAALEHLLSGDVAALRERAAAAADRIPDTGDQFTHMVRVYRRLLAEKRWQTPRTSGRLAASHVAARG